MSISEDLRNEIIAGLRKLRSPSKVSRQLGIELRTILPIADELAGTPRVVREEQHGGYGKPELREFLLARKRAHETWDNNLPTIAAARLAYEAGTHDMFTGRDGDWLLLYSKPQKKVTPRPDYFKPEV